MRVKFAHTVRHNMQDATLFTNPGTHVWTKHDAAVADVLLRLLRGQPSIEVSTLATLAATECPQTSMDSILGTWERMQTYPYVFEVAAARQDIAALALDGSRCSTAQASEPTRQLSLASTLTSRWRVPLNDFRRFVEADRLSAALFGFFALSFRKHAPAHVTLGKWHETRKRIFPVDLPARVGTFYYCFPHFGRVGYITLFVLACEHSADKAKKHENLIPFATRQCLRCRHLRHPKALTIAVQRG